MKTKILFRLVAIVLSVAMLFTMSACKNEKENSSDSDVEYLYVDENGNPIDGNSINSSNNGSAEGNNSTGDKNSSNGSAEKNNSANGSTGDKNSANGSAGKNNSANDSTANNNSGNAEQKGDGKVEAVNNCYTSGTKIAKDPITFTIMIRDHGAGLAKYDNSSFAKFVKDKMNITLKFQVCSDGVFQEKLTLAYASNKLPDMFWGMAPATTMHNPYIKKGQVAEVGTLVEKYAPNIKKMYKENPSAKYLTTFDDGKSYMIPMVNNNNKYGQMLYINNTWLKNLGLKIPSTVDELYNVLKKFKSEDANNNGNRNDEIPFMVSGEIDPSLFGAWGTNTYWNGMSIDDESGKVYYGYTSESYRNAMKYFNKLFKEGLLDQNLRGTKPADIYARSSASVQTVGVFAAPSYGNYVSADSFQKNYVIMPLLTVKGTNPQYYYNIYENDWAEWCVMTSACKYKECAIRLVDSLYSTEGTLLARYGAPGNDGVWNYDSNGKVVFQFNKKPASMKSLSEWVYSRTPGYALPHYASEEFYKLVNDANAAQNSAEKYEQTQVKAIYSKVSKENAFPKVYFTDAQVAALDKIGDYATLRSDMFWKFLSGTASLDNDWDTYVSQMNRLGLNDAVSTYQKAYNSYLVWLKKNS